MSRPRAGYIGFNRVPTTSAAPGVWTLREAEAARRSDSWPSADIWRSLVAFWRLSDTSDASGNGKTFTNTGATFSAGKIGNAATFDGNSYLSTSALASFGGADFSVAGWFKDTSGTSERFLVACGSGEAAFYIVRAGSQVKGSVNFDSELFVGSGANDAGWHFFAMTRSSTAKKIWLDTASATSTGTFGNVNSPVPFVLGSNAAGNYIRLVGQMDAVGLWNRTLSDGEIASLYNGGAGLELPAALAVPEAPSSLNATPGNSQVSLSWTAPVNVGSSAITDYVKQYSLNGGSTWTTFSSSASTTTSATITGLTNGTAYVFRVAAVNAVGTGAYTAASSSVTPSAADPFTTKIINVNGPNNATTSYGSWSGSGTASSKLTPSGTFKSAKLITGISGTLRITGTVNDGFDSYGHSIRKNGGAGLIATNGVLSINVSVSVSPGDEITFSSDGYGGASFWPTADDFMFGNSDRTNSTSDIRVWIE